MENGDGFERFKNQLLEIAAYSDIHTFRKFCLEHARELEVLRRQLAQQVEQENLTCDE